MQDIAVDNQNYHRSLFSIEGMSCSSCVLSLETILKALPGLREPPVVSLLPPEAVLVHDINLLKTDAIQAKIEKVGFDATLKSSVPTNQTAAVSVVTLSIEGMACLSCVDSIETCIKKQNGISQISVNLQTCTVYLC